MKQDRTDLDELIGITAATADDRMPRVLIRADVNGVPVHVVEPVLLDDLDGPARRGYVWHAVTGDYDLRPAEIVAGRCVPGVATGGVQLATSTVSAAAALGGARRRLMRAGVTR